MKYLFILVYEMVILLFLVNVLVLMIGELFMWLKCLLVILFVLVVVVKLFCWFNVIVFIVLNFLLLGYLFGDFCLVDLDW